MSPAPAFHLYEGETSAMTKVHDAISKEEPLLHRADGDRRPRQEALPYRFNGKPHRHRGDAQLGSQCPAVEFSPPTRTTARTPTTAAAPSAREPITLEGDKVTRNLAFYTIAQVSKFVRPGSVHVQSSIPSTETLANVAFVTPDHRKVLLVANTAKEPSTFSVHWKSREFHSTLGAGDVATYVWR